MRLNNQPEIIAILRNIVEDNSQRLYKEYDIYEQCYMSMCIYIHIYIYKSTYYIYMRILVIIDKTRVNINYYLCVIFKERLVRNPHTAAPYVSVIIMRVCIYEIEEEKKMYII